MRQSKQNYWQLWDATTAIRNMSALTTTDDIKQLGTILGVWAHPDDESFSCGGILAAAVKNGQQIACITATKGELGVQDPDRWPPESLGEIRAAELAAALKEIGCGHHHWLNYSDGGCKDIDSDEAINKILEFIEQYQPDTILTFGPDGLTGHDDHRTVSAWATAAAKQASGQPAVYYVVQHDEAYEKFRPADKQFNIFFNIDKPPLKSGQECDILLDLPDEILDIKYAALKAMPSQTEAMFKTFDKQTMCAMLSTEAFVKA